MQDITSSLGSVTGGITAAKARTILQNKFPNRQVELPREITGDDRSLRIPFGGWRGVVHFPGQDVQMEVTGRGRIHRDFAGQGDL